MKKKLFVLCTLLVHTLLFAQGTIKGKVIDAKTRSPLPFVNLLVSGTTIGTVSNEQGEFVLTNIPYGYISIQASFLGFETQLSDTYLVTAEKTPFIKIAMVEDATQLDEIVINRPLFIKKTESPTSLQTLGIEEIERNPGGNRDVLKVIQSLPGVASNPGFRNDIIIRGGSPSENKFFLDGIEVPVVNHFQTQGATGGPVGILNTDLIRNASLYTSAFPANRGNALSSFIEFTQKNGNPDRLNVRATIGTSDAGVTLDGPLSSKTTFIASVRQSYLQLLFKALKLPFLPTYNDMQFKLQTQLSDRSELSIIGLGAIDNFALNESVNKDVTDEETIIRNEYILGNLPVQEQWNYTIGATYKRFQENSNQLLVLSRNEWNNSAVKYQNNTYNPSDLLLDYNSKETETKLRFENNLSTHGFTINLGVGAEQAKYTNDTYQQFVNASGVSLRNFSSTLDLFKYAIFGQVSKRYADAKLGVSLGFRIDGNSYNASMKNGLNQFSPRFSLSYALTDKLSFNNSAGIYYQLPSYTVLGFRDNANALVNQNDLAFIKATHLVSGLEMRPNASTKISIEGYYKNYDNYPFSVRDQISLANLGSDFGVVGNEQVTSSSTGRAYGFEFLAQKKSYDGIYGILAYTFVKSEFKDVNGNFVPATWDNKHLLTFTGGKKLKKNWEVGLKYRLVGGRPYTPYDLNASSLRVNFDVANQGILDYTQLNTQRFATFSQLDIRIDKTWYWKRLSMNFYIDIQNALNSESVEQPFLTTTKDASGNPIVNANDTSRYVLQEIENTSGTILPRVGFIFDF